MKKKCVNQYIGKKERAILTELKAYIANPQTIAGWSVFTRYVIIGEIIPKMETEELKILLLTLHDATTAVTDEMVKRDGLKT